MRMLKSSGALFTMTCTMASPLVEPNNKSKTNEKQHHTETTACRTCQPVIPRLGTYYSNSPPRWTNPRKFLLPLCTARYPARFSLWWWHASFNFAQDAFPLCVPLSQFVPLLRRFKFVCSRTCQPIIPRFGKNYAIPLHVGLIFGSSC